MPGKKALQQGSNNLTKVEGDRVLKVPNPNGASFFELPYQEQAIKWNDYYKGTIYATVFVNDDGKLSTPYIEGSHPNDKERLAVCEAMLQNGFIMVDCRDKRNFIAGKDDTIFPVDFGQIYKQEDRFYKVHLKVVQRELHTIKSRLNNPQRGPIIEQYNPFKDVEDYIAALEKYKLTLTKDSKDTLAKDKVAQIDSFIADTKGRISKYNAGQEHAFDDYLETNKVCLEILAQNRASKPILYSVLLSLMIVPAICGAIQLAITNGNDYLFLRAVKGSEKRALEVQTKVIEIKDGLSKIKGSDSDKNKPINPKHVP
ncbi:MAG: hypothetical protein NXI01_02355 [Gammaproteobacteria bacterium]|nr:hypothetical protein [Gammaproteobacteria bacterium]